MSLHRIPDGDGAILATAPGQVWYLATGDTHSNSSIIDGTFSPAAHSDVSLVIEGRLEADNGKNVVYQAGSGTGFNVHVEPTGRLVAQGGTGSGALILSTEFNLWNEGRIVAKGNGAGVALPSGSDFGTIVNDGLIKSFGSWGTVIYGNSELVNHGRIISTAGLPSGGVGIGGSGNTVINDGLIRGEHGAFFVSAPGEMNTLLNEGRIVATGTYAVLGSNGQEKVINQGLLDGDVATFGGNDTLDNRHGEITGAIDLGDGNDTFLGSDAREVVRLGVGADSARMGGGNDKAIGDLGNDLLVGGDGNDRLRGQNGNDVLKGGLGDDRLAGGDGDDVLSGGRGNDVLFGGVGADVFQFEVNSGNDRIMGFDICVDRVDLSALGVADFTQVMNHASLSNGNTVIDLTALGGSGNLTLVGVDPGTLAAGDFFL